MPGTQRRRRRRPKVRLAVWMPHVAPVAAPVGGRVNEFVAFATEGGSAVVADKNRRRVVAGDAHGWEVEIHTLVAAVVIFAHTRTHTRMYQSIITRARWIAVLLPPSLSNDLTDADPTSAAIGVPLPSLSPPPLSLAFPALFMASIVLRMTSQSSSPTTVKLLPKCVLCMI